LGKTDTLYPLGKKKSISKTPKGRGASHKEAGPAYVGEGNNWQETKCLYLPGKENGPQTGERGRVSIGGEEAREEKDRVSSPGLPAGGFFTFISEKEGGSFPWENVKGEKKKRRRKQECKGKNEEPRKCGGKVHSVNYVPKKRFPTEGK